MSPSPQKIQRADQYVRLRTPEGEGVFSVAPADAERFPPGRRVGVKYERRGLGSLWRRIGFWS